MELKLRHAGPHFFVLPDHRAIREFPGYKLSKLTESVFIKITEKLIKTNPMKQKRIEEFATPSLLPRPGGSFPLDCKTYKPYKKGV